MDVHVQKFFFVSLLGLHTHLTESLPAFLEVQGNGDANERHLMFKASHCMRDTAKHRH